jgi:hypothetical protein
VQLAVPRAAELVESVPEVAVRGDRIDADRYELANHRVSIISQR